MLGGVLRRLVPWVLRMGLWIWLVRFPHAPATGVVIGKGCIDDAESGETMKAAGLKAIDTVVESTAVLVKSKNTTNTLVDLLSSRIRGVISASPLHPLNPTLQR